MYSGVISIFAERIKKGSPITLYGDGQQTRDFVNVADVVQANLLAMQVGCQKSEVKGQRSDRCSRPHAPCSSNFVVLNVATGHQTSLLELLDTLESITGNKVSRSFAPARAGDIRHSQADISRVQDILGYEPKGSFKEGLAELMR
jgi:UDP-glucose 4-epimerase